MSKQIMLVRADAGAEEDFATRLTAALRAVGCVVKECGSADANQLLDGIGAGAMPVVLKEG